VAFSRGERGYGTVRRHLENVMDPGGVDKVLGGLANREQVSLLVFFFFCVTKSDKRHCPLLFLPGREEKTAF